MRTLFLFVLALNIAYVGWQMTLSNDAEHQQQAARMQDTGSIVLLSEVQEETYDSLQADIEQTGSERSGPAQAGTDTHGDATGGDAASEDETVPSSMNTAQGSGDIKTGDGKKEREKDTEMQAAVLSGEVSDEAGAIGSLTNDRCFTIGPFRKLEKLRGFVRDIRPYVVEANFRDQKETYRSVYWIYIKPAKDRTAAKAIVKQLKKKKIKDYYIILKGEKVNGISLGHFKQKDRAFRYVKKLKKLGFDVELEPLFKTYSLYWLDYQLSEGKSVPLEIEEKFTQSGSGKGGSDSTRVTRLSRECGS